VDDPWRPKVGTHHREGIGSASRAAESGGFVIAMLTANYTVRRLEERVMQKRFSTRGGIADQLTEGPVHCDVLAHKTDIHPESLFRTLRALASVGVFSEVDTRCFALTPLAALLLSRAPSSMRSLAIMVSEEQYRAWGEMLYSVRTGKLRAKP